MKKLITYLIVVCIFSQTGITQSTFSLRFDSDLEGSVINSVYPTDSCIYAIGIINDSINPNIQGSSFLKLDLEGNILINKKYTSPYKSYAIWRPTLQETNDGDFIAAGYSIDTTKMTVILFKFDLNGDTIKTKEFISPNSSDAPFYIPRDLIIDNSNNYILTNTTSSSITNSNPELLILDKNLDKKISKVFIDEFRAKPQSVIQDTDDSYILSIYSINSNLVNKDFISKAHIIKVDTLGEIQWEYISPLDELQRPSAMVKAPDGGLIVCSGLGFEEPINTSASSLYFNNYIFKLDQNQEIEWEIDYSPQDTGKSDRNAFYKIHDVGDGYVAAGTNWDAETPAVQDGILHKISYDGETIWERKFYAVETTLEPALQEFYDMRITVDSGFIMVGQVLDYSQFTDFQRGWMVKVDKYGCLVPGCHLDTSTENPQAIPNIKIKVYPNPTSDFLNIYFKNPNLTNAGKFRLVNLNGSILLEFDADRNDMTYMVSLEKYATGIYFLQYIEAGVNLHSEQIIIQK